MKKILSFLLILALGLIFVGCGHTHEYGDWVVVKEATETEEGSKERVCECGEKETQKIEKVAHSHKYGEWVVIKEATETEAGSKERTCSCGEKETEVIAKLEHVHNFVDGECSCGEKQEHTHVFGEWVVVKEATEEEDGLKERVCECGEKESEVIAKLEHVHNFVDGECSCGEKQEHTHVFGEWVVVKEATEEEDGLKERVCECGEKESEEIAKLEHVHEFVDGKCACGAEEEIVELSVSISGPYYVIKDEYVFLEAIVVPEESADEELVWTSSNEEILTVEYGVVTGINEGTATVTVALANNPEITATRNITVVLPEKVAESFEITLEDEEIYDIDVYKFVKSYEPANAQLSLSYTSSDEEVATVDKSGNVTTLKEGEVTITAVDAISGLEYEYTFTVVASPALEGFEVKARDITTKETCTLNVEPLPAHANFNVTFEALTPEIATIDETGKVTPVTTGTAKFKVVDESGVSTEYQLEITEPIDLSKGPDSVTVVFDGDKQLFIGYTLRFTVEVTPSGVSSSVTWELHDRSVGIATISQDGVLTGVSEGTARVRCVSTINGTKSSWIAIEIVKEPELPEIPNLQGYEIVIMNADSALVDIDPFLNGYTQADKVYKQTAWNEVQTEYNCKITVKAYPAEAPWGKTRVNWIIDNATNGTSQTDFGVVSGSWMGQFAAANAGVDTTRFFQLYGKNQIEPALKEASSFNGKYYCVSIGLSGTRNYVIKGMFYNYGMIKELGLESPAKLFNEGRWTYSGFKEWVLQAQAILPENSYVLSGGPSIYWSGMVNSSGLKLADKVSMKLNLTHDYSIETIELLEDLVSEGCYAITEIGYDENCTPFREQRAIFQPGEFWFVRAANRWPNNLFGEGTTEYGYVPFPYIDTVAKEDTRVNFVGESVVMMIAGRSYPTGVEAEGVYRALQDMYLRTIDKQKSDPLYDAQEIKTASLKSKIDDPESITAAMFYDGSKTIFDPLFDESFQYDYSGETTSAVINSVKGADAVSEFDAIYAAVETKFIIAYGSN